MIVGATTDDAALVGAARSGDKAALAMLFERHRAMVRGLCWRMLRDQALAEDALQEAALQAMLALDRLRTPSRFGPWLGGIALNICRGLLQERRDVWSWDVLVGGRHLPEPIDSAPDPSVAAEERDLAARVRRAVDALPPGQRAAVLLVYLAGLSHAETAALLGAPVGAVKTRLHKARARLRRDLAMLWQEETMANDTTPAPIEVRVWDVRRRAADPDLFQPEMYCVVLEEVDGARKLPIWIARTEARAVVCKLEGIEMPRPLTDVLARRLLEAAGGRLAEVRVSRLADEIYYAVVVVEGPAGRAEVDARPSDAVNLAMLAEVPIRVDAAVMDQAAVVPDVAGAAAGAHPDRQVIADEIRDEIARGPEFRAKMAQRRTL